MTVNKMNYRKQNEVEIKREKKIMWMKNLQILP